MTVLQGEDSTTAVSETSADFFCYYSEGDYESASIAVKAKFPGKKYIGITTNYANIVGADVLDVENGAAIIDDAIDFIKDAKPPNLNLPTIYIEESSVAELKTVLTDAGIARDKYYIFQADWDDKDSVPPGVDIAQYENTTAYDKDVANSYVFKTTFPQKQIGTVHSKTTGGNATVYTVDGGQTWTFKKPKGF